MEDERSMNYVEDNSSIIGDCIIYCVSRYLVHTVLGNVGPQCECFRFLKSELDRSSQPHYYYTCLKAHPVSGKRFENLTPPAMGIFVCVK